MVKWDREEYWLDPEMEPETDTEGGVTYKEEYKYITDKSSSTICFIYSIYIGLDSTYT